MIRRLAIVLTLTLTLVQAARGQDLLPEEFQAWTNDRSFATFFPDGTYQGTEVFLRDRNVIWQGADGTCLKGIWQVRDGYICYEYEDGISGYCLTYRPDGDGLIGTTDTGEKFILLRGPSDALNCPAEPYLSFKTGRGQFLPLPAAAVTVP